MARGVFGSVDRLPQRPVPSDVYSPTAAATKRPPRSRAKRPPAVAVATAIRDHSQGVEAARDLVRAEGVIVGAAVRRAR